MKDKSKLIAASSEMFIYFNKIKKLYKFGPYNKNHGTAATFAFKKELLKKQNMKMLHSVKKKNS